MVFTTCFELWTALSLSALICQSQCWFLRSHAKSVDYGSFICVYQHGQKTQRGGWKSMLKATSYTAKKWRARTCKRCPQKRRVFQPPLSIGERMRQIRFRQQVISWDRIDGWWVSLDRWKPTNQKIVYTDLISVAKMGRFWLARCQPIILGRRLRRLWKRCTLCTWLALFLRRSSKSSEPTWLVVIRLQLQFAAVDY